MDARYKRLGKNTIIVFLGTAGSKLIGLLMLPYYTHYLSKAEYGSYDYINTYSLILLAFLTCCIADSIFVIPKNKNEEEKSRLFTSGFFFAVASMALVVLATLFFRDLLPDCFIKQNAWWIIALTYSTFFSSYAQQFTRSIDKMMVYSLTGVVYVLCIALFSFALLPKYKLDGYLFALVLSAVISSLFAVFFSKGYKYFRLKSFCVSSLKELLYYGIPLIPNSIMWWLVDGINRPIMASRLGVDAIGLYAVANKVPSFLSMLFIVFSNAWGISMIEEFDKPDFNSFFNKTLRLLYFVVSIGSAVLIIFTKSIIKILASDEFFDAWQYVPVLVLGVLFQNIASLVGGVFMAEQKSKYFFYSSLWGAATSLVMTLLLVQYMGLMGVCVAVALSFFCMTIVRIKYAWRYINELDIVYYCKMLCILLIQTTLYIYIANIWINIIVFFMSMSIMLLFNREEARILLVTTKKIFNKKSSDE